MSARAVLYKALCHADQMPANDFAKAMIEALLAAGYRILGPGELDAETLKRAAEAQCSGCATDVPINDAGYHQQGSFTFPCHAAAIRSLTPGYTDKEGRRE